MVSDQPAPAPSRRPAVAQFNLYNYANNSPYRFTDPDGRKGVDARAKDGNAVCARNADGNCPKPENEKKEQEQETTKASDTPVVKGGNGNAESSGPTTAWYDKLYRSFKNKSSDNQALDELLYNPGSPLSIDMMLKQGSYSKVGANLQTGDVYGKFSYKAGIYSVSANIDKNGKMFSWSFSVGMSYKVRNAELGISVNLAKLAPFAGEQLGLEFVEGNGMAIQALRAATTRSQRELDAMGQ